MREERYQQYKQWSDEGKPWLVAEAVEALPPEERDYQSLGYYARALNNLGRYDEALAVLEATRAEGDSDPVWHYRYAYCLLHLDRSREAVDHCHRVLDLGLDDEDVRFLLEWCQSRLDKEEARQARQRNKKHRDPDHQPFSGFDLTQFWEDSDYAREEYISEPPTAMLIKELEEELGYKLPQSYLWLMRQQNGGIPVNTNHPTDEPTSWAEDHVAITGIMGIGREVANSLGGEFGSRFWIEEWGYPDIGIAICDCPSAGHDMIFLDYRDCGPHGEPEVVHVDQEGDYEITFVAEDFESFIRGLVHDDVYDTSEEDKQDDLERVTEGAFSPLLDQLLAAADPALDLEPRIRELGRQIVEEKGFFALHADEKSYLLYDIQFLLYTGLFPGVSEEQYLEEYGQIIALASCDFTTHGYGPSFVTDWLEQRRKAGKILRRDGGLHLSPQFKAELLERIMLLPKGLGE